MTQKRGLQQRSNPLVSGKLMDDLIGGYAGNFFEGCWASDGALGTALLEWTKTRWPALHELANDDPLSAEVLVRDEQGSEELARFINSLDPALQRDALSAIHVDLVEWKEKSSKALAARLKKLLDKMPAPARARGVAVLLEEGRRHADRMDIDEGIACFDQVLALEPDNAQAYFGRGFLRATSAEYDLAIADLSRAIDADPEFAEAYLRRGLTRAFDLDEEGALADLQRAVELKKKLRKEIPPATPLLKRVLEKL